MAFLGVYSSLLGWPDYTGHTEDLEERFAQHQTGGYCDFTSRRLPVELVWSQDFQTRIEALEAERRIKSWSRAKKEALIRGDWEALSYYARPPKERSLDFARDERKGEGSDGRTN